MAQPNQTQIPVIQTGSGDLTQAQQNVNKVLRNIYSQVTDLQSDVTQTIIIGEIKIANVTLDQFQATTGKDWVLCDGSTCIGTEYSKLTKNNVVPNLTIGSINTFIRIN